MRSGSDSTPCRRIQALKGLMAAPVSRRMTAEGGRTGHVGEDGAVIARIGFCEGRILVGVGLPVELAAVHDHAAQRAAVAADELGRRMDHDVGAVLQRTDEDGCEGVVPDEHDVVLVGHGRDALEVGLIRIRIAEGLSVYNLRVGPDGSFEGRQVVYIDNGMFNPLGGKGMGDQIERTAVEVVRGDNVVAVLQDVLQGVGDGGGAGSDGQTGHTAFERGHALLEHGLRGVGQAAVDIARVAQAEAVGRVLGVAEDVGSGLINRNRAGIRSGIRGLLADMDGQRFNV